MTVFGIIALDPGATVGAAELLVHEGGGAPYFSSHQLPRHECAHWLGVRLRALHDDGRRTLVAVERFDVTYATVKKGHDAQGPIRMKGVAEYLASEYGHTFREYGRGDCKNLGTDELLRALAWYSPGQNHANDASRVLALALQDLHPPTFKRLVVESGYLAERSDPGTPRA